MGIMSILLLNISLTCEPFRTFGYQTESDEGYNRIRNVNERHRSPWEQFSRDHLSKHAEHPGQGGGSGKPSTNMWLRNFRDVCDDWCLAETASDARNSNGAEKHYQIRWEVKYQPGDDKRESYGHHRLFSSEISSNCAAYETPDWKEAYIKATCK